MTYGFSTMFIYIFLTCHSSIIMCNLHPLTVLPIHNHFKYILKNSILQFKFRVYSKVFPTKTKYILWLYYPYIIPVISYQDYYAVIFFKAKRAVFLSLNIFVFTRATCCCIDNSDSLKIVCLVRKAITSDFPGREPLDPTEEVFSIVFLK